MNKETAKNPQRSLLIAEHDTGEQVLWNPETQGHLLIAGGPGSGKTTAAQTIITSAISSGYEIHLIDVAKGGAEYQGIPRGSITSFSEQVSDAVQNLEHLARRGERKQDGDSLKPALVVVDEIGALSENDRFMDTVKYLVADGSSFGVHLVLLTQAFGSRWFQVLVNGSSVIMLRNDEQATLVGPLARAHELLNLHGEKLPQSGGGVFVGADGVEEVVSSFSIEHKHEHLKPTGQDAPASDDGDAVRQMSDGVKQFASGAKDFVQQRAVPAVTEAVQTVQNRVGESNSRNLGGWALYSIPVLAFLIVISLFLPAASMSMFGVNLSINFFSPELREEGTAITVVMVVVIALAAVAILLKKRWARFTAAGVAALAGVLAMIDGFGSMARMSEVSGASVGAGLILLSLFGTLMVVSAIAAAVFSRAVKQETEA